MYSPALFSKTVFISKLDFDFSNSQKVYFTSHTHLVPRGTIYQPLIYPNLDWV